MNVSFTGQPPDTFKDEAEVVAHGQLRSDGGFDANQVIAKCPSKYEAAGRAQAGS